MSFREKSAWIILITLIVMTIVYALHIPPPYTLAPRPNPFLFLVLMLAIGTFVGIVIVGHIVIAIMAPRDAKTAGDERERMIELRATAIASYVYAFLTLGGLFVLLHVVNANTIGIAYYILFSFVFAEIVNYSLRIYLYRRGF
jgi:hypothetical protein